MKKQENKPVQSARINLMQQPELKSAPKMICTRPAAQACNEIKSLGGTGVVYHDRRHI